MQRRWRFPVKPLAIEEREIRAVLVLQHGLFHMKGTLHHQLPEQALVPGPMPRTLLELTQLAPRLPGARRTHRKRRNHRDSHDVTNNILACTISSLRYYVV